MDRLALASIAFVICWSQIVVAASPSYRAAHPIGWMHSAPVGEQPGWTSRIWADLEFNQANIWNNQFDMIDRRNGRTYTYAADFEQSSFILDFGVALTPWWAMALEVPYAARGGGFLDDIIDQFHILIGGERFLRNYNPDFNNDFEASTDGVDSLNKQSHSGTGNVKLKTKFWLLQWRGSNNGSCECGLAISGQAKFPVTKARSSFTSGHEDYSGLVHVGIPIKKESGVWATAAFTHYGENDLLKGWPLRRYGQMYEIAMDLGVTNTLGLILQARLESPIMNKNDLEFVYTSPTPDGYTKERVASGWNSLVYWRSTQAAGLRLRSQKGHQFNILFIEDFGLGDQDSPKDGRYVSNAPDIAVATQFHFNF